MAISRRSKTVGLTLVGLPLGAVALATALPQDQMRRNLYSDRAACERDYSLYQCEPSNSSSSSSTSSGGGHGGSGGYRGPAYYADRNSAAARTDPGTGRTGQVTLTQASTRGGFGNIGHAFSGGS
jgi:hypothetical protein